MSKKETEQKNAGDDDGDKTVLAITKIGTSKRYKRYAVDTFLKQLNDNRNTHGKVSQRVCIQFKYTVRFNSPRLAGTLESTPPLPPL